MTGVTNNADYASGGSHAIDGVVKQAGNISFHDENHKNFALKFDGQLPYQYLKFGVGLLKDVPAPTTKALVDYYATVMNYRMAGHPVTQHSDLAALKTDIGAAPAHVNAAIYGAPVFIGDSSTAENTDLFSGFAREHMSQTYMHFAQ